MGGATVISQSKDDPDRLSGAEDGCADSADLLEAF
jgi:hypothetical protein